MSERRIDIASEFSPYPGGRYKADGSFSGQEFREEFLLPALQEVPGKYSRVVIVLDGVAGYPASFLEEAFGGLVRVHGFRASELSRVLMTEASDPHFDTYRRLAKQYIEEAERRLPAAVH